MCSRARERATHFVELLPGSTGVRADRDDNGNSRGGSSSGASNARDNNEERARNGNARVKFVQI